MRRAYAWFAPGILLASALVLSLTCNPAANDVPAATDGVFIHVSTGPEDPHRVLMALRMAEVMADDHDVLMYFDIRGVYVLLEDAEDLAREPFDSSAAMIPRLLEAGVEIYACPTCLKVAEKSPDDLAEGIRVANKQAFFDFTKGRILSLDY